MLHSRHISEMWAEMIDSVLWSSYLPRERIFTIGSLLVFEKIEIGVMARAGDILARHANKSAGEAGKTRRGGFIGQNTCVELLRKPLPTFVNSFDAIGKM